VGGVLRRDGEADTNAARLPRPHCPVVNSVQRGWGEIEVEPRDGERADPGLDRVARSADLIRQVLRDSQIARRSGVAPRAAGDRAVEQSRHDGRPRPAVRLRIGERRVDLALPRHLDDDRREIEVLAGQFFFALAVFVASPLAIFVVGRPLKGIDEWAPTLSMAGETGSANK
jgi:hypothetical protein